MNLPPEDLQAVFCDSALEWLKLDKNQFI
jgi:hypothetical protein